METKQTFLVGGAVRDQLLGREVKDRDFVVVGSTPEQMIADGFTKVGADFPVFLSENGEEFALARTERKTGKGYNGFETTFDPSVSLEDDLARRDLTINAMAREVDLESGEVGPLVDPFNGAQDIEDKILRPVSSAFREDPIRVLRAARFHARFGPEWTVSPRIDHWAEAMIAAGEFDAVPNERFVAEMEKAIMEDFFPLFFTGAVADVLEDRFGVRIDHSAVGRIDFDDIAGSSLEWRIRRLVQADQSFEVLFNLMGCSNAWMIAVQLAVLFDSNFDHFLLAAFRNVDGVCDWIESVTGNPRLPSQIREAVAFIRFNDFEGFINPADQREAMERARINFVNEAQEDLMT